MPEDLFFMLAIVAAVVIYVLAKVIHYARKSKEQWRQVDRSKLKEWQDDDEW